MTKRFSKSEDKNNIKKPKLDDDIEALWGDEFDANLVELASQALGEDENKANESILPPYDVFRAPKPIFSSTQMDACFKPTTSNSSKFPFDKSKFTTEIELQKLRSQCEEKDGEVAILRGQLREAKTQSNIEFQKSHSEWKAKLTLTEKQIQTVKSELEFKNLEIANLKQKVLVLTKRGLNVTNYDVTRSPKPSTSKENLIEPQGISTPKLYPLLGLEYPLKAVLIDLFLTIPKREKFIIDKLNHSFKNAIPYLQNKSTSRRVVLDKNRADLHSIYPIMLKLCDYTSEDLRSIDNIENITKIVCVGLQSLDDLLDLLKDIKKNLRTEDLLEADALFLKNMKLDNNYINTTDLGRKAAFIIHFLSVLIQHSDYLSQYFIYNKQLDLSREDFAKIPYLASKPVHKGQDFLNKLITIINFAGDIRKSNVMTEFLNSTIKLFTSICKLNGYHNLSESVCHFTKQIIFARPALNVIFELTHLLKELSRYSSFVQFLLNKTKDCNIMKKGILYFNEGNCRFYVFVLIFDRGLTKNITIPVEICLNMLFFIYNTYKSSYFLHHQDIKECECLPQLYKLEIELIFRMLDRYADEVKTDKTTCNWTDVFNNKIILKVLNLMAFHCYELTEKFITVYSQFKEIERRLREKGVYDLERLNINEDIPRIDSNNFENIGF